jgi:hypothetical protein
MKRLVSTLFVVATLCTMLAIPAAAAGPVEVSGMAFDGPITEIEFRPIGKGEDDHYCLVTVDAWSTMVGDIDGELFEHIEVLSQSPCGSGPGTSPSMQRLWGEFTGAIWDGERMRSGTCKEFGTAGWHWADDGTSLHYDGSFTMHACSGDLAGAHAQFDYDWDDDAEVAIITGRAFFSGKP